VGPICCLQFFVVCPNFQEPSRTGGAVQVDSGRACRVEAGGIATVVYWISLEGCIQCVLMYRFPDVAGVQLFRGSFSGEAQCLLADKVVT
jgi:hypothetical protein